MTTKQAWEYAKSTLENCLASTPHNTTKTAILEHQEKLRESIKALEAAIEELEAETQ